MSLLPYHTMSKTAALYRLSFQHAIIAQSPNTNVYAYSTHCKTHARAHARTHTVRVIFGLIHVYFHTFARFLNGKCRTHTNITHASRKSVQRG